MILIRKAGKHIAFVIMIFAVACSPRQREFYISPQGNDQNPGTRALPFATLEKANQTIIHQSSISNADITIWMEPGIHNISQPVVFSSDTLSPFSGKIRIASTSEEPTIISGGRRLNKWQKSNNNLWSTQIPHTMAILNQIRELFIDGQRVPRARFPNDGYLRVKKVGADRRTNFYFEQGDFPMPIDLQSTELVLLHDWSISRIPIQEIDSEKMKLTAVDSIGAKVLDFFNLDHWEQQPRYFLENDLAFVDRDYEWCFEPIKRKIWLRLPQDVDIKNLHITIPVSEGLVVLRGAKNQPIKNIHFQGISFHHSTWEIPKMGYGGIQATHFDPRPNLRKGWSVVPAAVAASYADSCSFQDCTFKQLGGSGLWLGEGCSNNLIRQCRFADISGNGIMIGEGRDRKIQNEVWWKAEPEQAAKNNIIDSCDVQQCGVQFFGAVGIWCGLTKGTFITNNHLHHLPYTGISIGWMWNPNPTPARENIISGNHIHHIMQTLSDGGGIYMLGLQPGSKLINNLIHDVSINVGRAESNGLFLDEGITDVEVEGNVIYNIAKSPIRFHKATTNLVHNNYLFVKRGIPAFAYNNTDASLIRKSGNQIHRDGDEQYHVVLERIVEQWHQKK